MKYDMLGKELKIGDIIIVPKYNRGVSPLIISVYAGSSNSYDKRYIGLDFYNKPRAWNTTASVIKIDIKDIKNINNIKEKYESILEFIEYKKFGDKHER